MANSMANDVAAESVFFKQLDDTGRKRYKQKLDQLGLNEDPYVMSAGFETDMSLWPPVEFPDICTKKIADINALKISTYYYLLIFVQNQRVTMHFTECSYTLIPYSYFSMGFLCNDSDPKRVVAAVILVCCGSNSLIYSLLYIGIKEATSHQSCLDSQLQYISIDING